ncbi:hypothetical protein Tdes44962_MAKER09490, partial [Teratosphaeria destructans]
LPWLLCLCRPRRCVSAGVVLRRWWAEEENRQRRSAGGARRRPLGDLPVNLPSSRSWGSPEKKKEEEEEEGEEESGAGADEFGDSIVLDEVWDDGDGGGGAPMDLEGSLGDEGETTERPVRVVGLVLADLVDADGDLGLGEAGSHEDGVDAVRGARGPLGVAELEAVPGAALGAPGSLHLEHVAALHRDGPGVGDALAQVAVVPVPHRARPPGRVTVSGHGVPEQALPGEGVEEAVDPAAAGEQRAADARGDVAHGGAVRQRQHHVHTWVERHEHRDAIDGFDRGGVGHGGAHRVRGEEMARLLAQGHERHDVDQDGAELDNLSGREAEETQHQAPALTNCQRESAEQRRLVILTKAESTDVCVAVNAEAQSGQDIGKGPDAHDGEGEMEGSDALSVHGRVEGVEGDGEDEEARGDVATVQQPALREARLVGGGQSRCRWGDAPAASAAYLRGSQDGVDPDPVEADDERRALLQVGQQQVEDEDDVLVVADPALVVRAPADEAEADEADDGHGRQDGHEAEDAEGHEAVAEGVAQVGVAVGRGEVFAAMGLDLGLAGRGAHARVVSPASGGGGGGGACQCEATHRGGKKERKREKVGAGAWVSARPPEKVVVVVVVVVVVPGGGKGGFTVGD